MPANNSFIQLFIDHRKPLTKVSIKPVENDWLYLESVFPETGFRSYFLAAIVSKLANELRNRNITTYEDRLNHPELHLSRLLSDIRLIGQASGGYVGTGTVGTRQLAAPGSGTAAGSSHPVKGQGESTCETPQV